MKEVLEAGEVVLQEARKLDPRMSGWPSAILLSSRRGSEALRDC